MASVDFDRVDKTYPGGIRAVAELSLAIADGELLVLVGPSGCGKSTALRLLAGLETPTAGEIRIGNERVNERAPQERNVAMVFQDYALYPHMTVRGNLEFPLKMRRAGREDIAARVAKAAQQLDIAALLDRLPKELSGGQRQRVAMGRALVREPAVFLLDEPLSNLDARLRVQVRAEIGALQERMRTTMVYVTHDQVEAMTLGHRVAVMDRGVLQQCATPTDLYAHPVNAFVAGFIGNPPMNLLAIQPDGQGIRIGSQTLAVAKPPTGATTLGIRPEALNLDAKGSLGLDAIISHVEWLGHETLVHAALPDKSDSSVVARAAGMRDLKHGEKIRLGIEESSLYWFDHKGRTIGLTTP